MKTFRVTVEDAEYQELQAWAKRDKRTLNQQAAFLLHELIPNLKARRTEDTTARDPETDPIGGLPRREEEKG